ncbi:uncharacterized protein LOC109861227 [Pseudomyrmex gracilis]|uniref:uncharacterized protein LOC109861227 n=1 Tax=Pseudomyrmex gracilis TaxID=219809 RepID=UPI00099534CF|nr:uncharacterized protein LOC109861227 [Pseudomyrmex gracilis]
MDGHLLMEVGEEDRKSRADLLASKLREALSGSGKKARPSRNVEVLVSGLDKFSTEDELREKFLREFGDGKDARIVSLRRSPSKDGTALVCCSEAAAKAVKEGKLPIGWIARVRALCPRSLQCYRCFQPRHCRAQCSSQVNRSD